MKEFSSIPNFSSYQINRDGIVINTKTGKELPHHLSYRGYEIVHLKRDDGMTKTVSLHRLLMTVFRPQKNMESLTVDHIDGNKRNNSLDNLEWVTSTENIRRAAAMGKYKGFHNKPIEVLDPKTGKTQFFPSLAACRRSLNLGRSSIQYRLSQAPDRVFPEGLQYRLASPGTDWNINKHPDYALKQNGTRKSALLQDVVTEQIYTFHSLGEMAVFLKRSLATMSTFTKRWMFQPVVPGGYIFKMGFDPNPWRKCQYWIELIQSYASYKPVEVYDEKTRTLKRFENAIIAAPVYNIKFRCAQYRVTTNGTRLFSDSTRWGFFPSLSKILNVPPESNFRMISL